MKSDKRWLVPFGELPQRRQVILLWLSFALPLIVWAVVSYVPFVWHPLVKITEPGGAGSMNMCLMAMWPGPPGLPVRNIEHGTPPADRMDPFNFSIIIATKGIVGASSIDTSVYCCP